MNIYIHLEQPNQLQKFWVNYLRGDNTFIINGGDGAENINFNHKNAIPEEHKSNCKKITLGANVFPINKKFFNYILKRPKDTQRYVENFPNPENSDELFLVHDPQLEIIKKISFKKFTWFFNSEPYDDIRTDHTILDELHCMPTGFKSNLILSKSYTKNTKIFYYDFNSYMLKFKQRLIENWNGYDYPEFINSYGFKPDLLPDNFDKKQLESQWNNELHQWGGANAFARVWNFQKRFEYKFIELDLFNEFEKIKISNTATCWFSNIFFYPTLFFQHPEQKIWAAFDDFMTHIKQFNTTIYIKDPFGWNHRHDRL